MRKNDSAFAFNKWVELLYRSVLHKRFINFLDTYLLEGEKSLRVNRKYLAAVTLLAVLAVVFGLAGTVMPLADVVTTKRSLSSPDSVTHFVNPPTYDSGWVDITDKCGQYFNISHDLNTTGGGEHRRNLGGTGYTPGWNKRYGGPSSDDGLCIIQTSDGGYALTGFTDSYGAGGFDRWLVKTDAGGNME